MKADMIYNAYMMETYIHNRWDVLNSEKRRSQKDKRLAFMH